MTISRVEDLGDAVHGAGIEATQMSAGRMTGSLIFCEHKGIVYSGGSIQGRVALRGPLSASALTIGAVLHLEGACRHWLREVENGAVGVFHGGDEHDAYYTAGALYATATISLDRLEHEAAKEELVLDRATLGGTRVHGRVLSQQVRAGLKQQFAKIHDGQSSRTDSGSLLLRALIEHLGRPPHDHAVRSNGNLHAKIVERARTFIVENLAEPIALDDIAAAAYTSRRSLFRAFADIFDDTPQGYVRRLRLHRIRQGLASDSERTCTIAIVANQWGVSELGRLAGWYREMFDELPSETLAQAQRTVPRMVIH
ncbi:helix-turn-helix domain-containing protein [Rhizobium sp. WYJ-E13]|nr:helix-turn-helix domain-containing protein [Rhizobium sp. WYJ-E13]